MSKQTRAILPKFSSLASKIVAAVTALFAAAPAMAQEGAPAQAPAQSGGGFTTLIMIVLLFAIFYFMMIRPQQRKEKERQKMISELRAGRKVSFAGGLIGTIKEAKEQTFVIEICPGSTVEVARGAVMAAADEPAAELAKK